MGYINDLEAQLQKKLSELDEKKRNDLIKFIKQAVVESYKNGIMLARMAKAGKEANRKGRQFSRDEQGK